MLRRYFWIWIRHWILYLLPLEYLFPPSTSFSLDGIKLKFTEDAINAIAEKSYQQKTGARGLRSIVEKLMLSFSYEVPSIPCVQEVVVDKDNVENGTNPKIYGENNLLIESK